MSRYQILKTEIETDPLARGYSTMTDQEVADRINTYDRNKLKAAMSSSEVLNAVNMSEFNLLTTEEKTLFMSLLAMGTLNPQGVEASIIIGIFGAGSATVSSLAGARQDTITRGQELGLGDVKVGWVTDARNA